MKRTIFILMATIGMALTGCEGPQGEKGDTGAIGPQGPAGTSSGTGTKGDKGDKGDTGNANVINSGWKKFGISDWKRTTGFHFLVTVVADNLTNDVVQNGVLLTFIKNSTSGLVLTLPVTTNKDWSLYHYYKEKTLYIEQFYPAGAPAAFAGISGYDEFRYVMIPASTTGRFKGIDYSNYSEVCQRLGIQE